MILKPASCEITLVNTGDEVIVKAKSKAIEDILREVATGISGETDNERWEHLKKYRLDEYPKSSGGNMGLWGYNNLAQDGRINLSFLRAVGLSGGIEVKLLWNCNSRTRRNMPTYIRREVPRMVRRVVPGVRFNLLINDEKPLKTPSMKPF